MLTYCSRKKATRWHLDIRPFKPIVEDITILFNFNSESTIISNVEIIIKRGIREIIFFSRGGKLSVYEKHFIS
jgi:hypothetical protein